MWVRRFLGGLPALVLGLSLPGAALAIGTGFFEAHFDTIRPDTGIGVAESLEEAEDFAVEIVPQATSSSSGLGGRTARLFEAAVSAEVDFLDLDTSAGTVTYAYSSITLMDPPEREPGELLYVLFISNELDDVYESRELGFEGDDILVPNAAGDLEFYYPSFLLEDGVDDTLAIDVTLRNGFELDGSVPIMPDFEVGFAYVIPEPGTAALLTLGLAGLALLSGRRYSA